MNNFERLKSMSMDELVEWLDKHLQFDASPWCRWFDTNYCKNCEPIMCNYPNSDFQFPCAWCELENKCKYFSELDGQPNTRDFVKMWLESEVEYEKV